MTHETQLTTKMTPTVAKPSPPPSSGPSPSPAPAVRGVTFDLDDTLWSGAAVLGRASAAFHALITARVPAFAAAFPPAAFSALMARFMRELPERAHDFSFLRRHALRHCLAELAAAGALDAALDQDALLEAAVAEFLAERSRPEFFAGVDDMLHGLQALLDAADDGAPALGVVTNGNCQLHGLPAAFQRRLRFLVSAEGVGAAKPSAAIFDAAVARFPPGLARAQLVHVGDHYACDVEGAKRAGLRTVWVRADWRGPDALRREDLPPDVAAQFPAADAIVRDVAAVLRVVALWNQQAADSQASNSQASNRQQTNRQQTDSQQTDSQQSDSEETGSEVTVQAARLSVEHEATQPAKQAMGRTAVQQTIQLEAVQRC